MVLGTLTDVRTRERGLFEPDYVERMIDQHTRLEGLHGHRLWTLFMLEMWQRNVLAGPRDRGPAVQ